MATSLTGKRISEQYTELLIRDEATKRVYTGDGTDLRLYADTSATLAQLKFGNQAGTLVDPAASCITMGTRSGASSPVGIIAIGDYASQYSTGAFNTAVGVSTLSSNVSASGTTSVGNSAFGYGALSKLLTGSNNVAVGTSAANLSTTLTTGVFIGESAGLGVSGTDVTLVGHGAASTNTWMTGCSALGALAFNSSPSAINNSTALGNTAQVTGDNQVQLGNASTTTYAYGAVQLRSDIRDKTAVRDTVFGLDFIMALRPVDYKWDFRDSYVDVTDSSSNITNVQKDGTKVGTRYHHGFIAQEVESIINATNVDFGGYQDHSIAGGFDVKSLGYSEFIGPLVKAIQELKLEFDAYKAEHP
ncbi:MAG: tail fiber domain-containing protein [Bacteroidales bacterium]